MEEEKSECITIEEVLDLLYKTIERRTNTFRGKRHERTFYYNDAIACLTKLKVSLQYYSFI